MTTKTLKMRGGTSVKVPLAGYSAGLSSDSMDEREPVATKPSIKRKKLPTRKRAVTPPPKQSKLLELFGSDFDLTGYETHGFLKKGKEKAVYTEKEDESEVFENDLSGAEIEEADDEDGVDANYGQSSSSSPKLAPAKVPSAYSATISSASWARKRTIEDDALTATDSEEDEASTAPVIPGTWRRTRSKITHSPEGTASESEAIEPVAKRANQSDTESEPEESGFAGTRPIDPLNDPLKPRPAFTATAEQQDRGPLVLDGLSGTEVPRSVAMFLRPYQEVGTRFFWERWNEDRGGILGDDMGLGKTIQVLAFLSAIFRKSGNMSDAKRRYNFVNDFLDSHSIKELPPANAQWPTCLIVAPKTVVGNWQREIETWTYFEAGVYMGTASDRADVLRNFKMGRYDLLLTSHEFARSDISILESCALSCIFVDEAHKIKNDKSQTAVAYNRFECQVRFGLTGTLLQNKYSEMWPLLNWSNPGRLGTEKEWARYVAKPLSEGQSKSVNKGLLLFCRDVIDRLNSKVLQRFFLRRTKDIIKHELPTKIDNVVFCPLTETQIAVYERFLATEDVQLMVRKDENCDCGSKKKRGSCCHKENSSGVPWHKLLLKYMDVLIKISNNLLLIYPGPDDTPEQVQRNRELIKIAFPDGGAGTYATALANKQICGKWEVLEKLLHLWKKESGQKNKVLIFSKSVKLLEFLSMWLGASGFAFRQLDGKVKQEDRFKCIDDFNLDPDVFVFLISTLAGGTGLNLVAANKVVIFDPNWNPAHDLQAMDRAYRFGQQRDVSVYRLLGAGSLEELIYARQLYKQQQMRIAYDASHQTRLFQGVQGDKTRQGELFGIKNILTLRKDLSTKEQIEKAYVGDLSWALAHTDDPEEDASQLSAFLLNDQAVPKIETRVPDEEAAILSKAGIKYTHRNEDLLRDNQCEAGRIAKLQQKRKKNPRKPSKDQAPWPPKRAHHGVLLEQRLQNRRDAIIAAGYDLATFAQEFVTLTPDQQAARLQELESQAETSSAAASGLDN